MFCSERCTRAHFKLKPAFGKGNYYSHSHSTYEELASEEILDHMTTFVPQLGDAQPGSNPGSPASKVQLSLTNQELWEQKCQTEMNTQSARNVMNHNALLSRESEQNRIICSNGLKTKDLTLSEIRQKDKQRMSSPLCRS